MRRLELTEEQARDLDRLRRCREWATFRDALIATAADVKLPLVDVDQPLKDLDMARRLGFLAGLEYALDVPGLYGQQPDDGAQQ